jgi:prepilin-type N-terminal cleavage/methylation domain-containing protein
MSGRTLDFFMKFANSGYPGQHGFSLLELLVVLGIMGILAGIGFSGINGARHWMTRHRTQVLFKEIESACRLYRHDHGVWPDALTPGFVELNGCGESFWEALAPYLERMIVPGSLEDGYHNSDIRAGVDLDGDRRISGRSLPGIVKGAVPEEIWKSFIIYSLDKNGELAAFNWEGRPR